MDPLHLLYICCTLAAVSGLPFVVPLLVQLSCRYHYIILIFPFQQENTHIMVVGGYSDAGYESAVEVVSLSPESIPAVPDCMTGLADFPYAVYRAAAGLIFLPGILCKIFG